MAGFRGNTINDAVFIQTLRKKVGKQQYGSNVRMKPPKAVNPYGKGYYEKAQPAIIGGVT